MPSTDIVQAFTSEWALMPSNAQPSTAAFTGTSESFECITDTVGVNETISKTSAIMGVRWAVTERSRKTGEAVAGTLTQDCSPAALAMWLPYILSDPSSPHTNQIGTYTEFDFMRHEPVTDWLFRNCVITKATFKPGSSGLISMALDVVGRVGTIDESFANAAVQTDAHDDPYANYEAVINLASGTRYVTDWELMIEQGIEVVAANSLTVNRAKLGEATASLKCNMEWSTANKSAVYGQGKSGIAASLTFAQTTHSCVFTIPSLLIPREPVGVSDGDMRYNVNGTAQAAVGATELITITNDSET